MPYTERHPIYVVSALVNYVSNKDKTRYVTVPEQKDEKEILRTVIDYAVNEAKTFKKNNEEETSLISSHLCDIEVAAESMWETAKRYHKEKDQRQAYHLIQGFHFADPITPEQCHEIGCETALALYPDFKFVVATHMDRGHLHNHIVINATAEDGHKLKDTFYEKPEGLMAIRETSDRIARISGWLV